MPIKTKGSWIKLAVFSVFFICMASLAFLFHFAFKKQDDFQKPTDVQLATGQSLASFAKDLKDKQVITSEEFFSFLVKIMGAFPKAKAGRYRFEETVSPLDIIERIVEGKVFHELMLELTVPEGQTAAFIVQKLKEKGMDDKQLLALFFDKNFIKSLGVEGSSLEGFIYPATYQFYDNFPSPEEFWIRTVQEFFKKIPKDFEVKVKEKGLTLKEAVIFASLIEKETANDEERNQISEVIWNRLQSKEPLGIDASIIYGIKDYKGDIKSSHLRDKNNLYNSRIYRGLPPTPIASPSLKSLLAVLTPTSFGFYYYVLKPGEEKAHHFSKTLKEHNIYVKALIDYVKNSKR